MSKRSLTKEVGKLTGSRVSRQDALGRGLTKRAWAARREKRVSHSLVLSPRPLEALVRPHPRRRHVLGSRR